MQESRAHLRGGNEMRCGVLGFGAAMWGEWGFLGGIAVWFKEGAVISAWSSGIRIPATSPVISGDGCAEPERKGRGRC